MRCPKLVLTVFATCVLLGTIAQAGQPANEKLEDLSRSVVQIYSAKQSIDLANPWQKKKVVTKRYLGTLLDGGLILVSAEAVVDATNLVMTSLNSSERYSLSVDAVDYEVNLALLRPKSDQALKDLVPVELDLEGCTGASVNILNVARLDRPALYTARVSKSDIQRSRTSTYRLVSYTIDVKGTDFGWSEPVFYEGNLVALAADASNSFLRAIPATVISHFVSDVRSGNYRGFVNLDVVTNPLDSPMRRRVLRVSEGEGVRIVRLLRDALVTSLRPDDVLLSIGDKDIDAQGRIEHPIWGKIGYQAAINDLFVGEVVTFRISRGGNIMNVRMNLPRVDSRQFIVPARRHGESEPYLIVGGFVLQELTRPFLETWGEDWPTEAPVSMANIALSDNRIQSWPGERIIVVNRVLADPVNHGYEQTTYRILDTVNGEKVSSLNQIKAVLQDQPLIRNDKAYAKLAFRERQGEVILSYDSLPEANARIAATYGIHTSAAFFSRVR